PPISDRLVLVADRDDDDADGVADGLGPSVTPAARVDLVPLDARFSGAVLSVVSGGELVRLVAGGKALPWGVVAPRGAQLQGLGPGRAVIVARRGDRESAFAVEVHAVGLRDG